MNPYFSIIVPTYNRAELLQKCIDSILQQSFEDFELIIVDDGSKDNTEKKVKAYADSRIRYFKKKHSERSRTRNFGIDKATGRFICFVDDDDYILNNHLELFKKGHDQSSEQHIIRTGFYSVDGEKERYFPNYAEKKYRNPVKFIADNMCGVGSLCIPSDYLQEMRFPEAFIHWQDTYLFLRLLSKHPFFQISAYSYVYVIHEGMGSRQSLISKEAEARIETNVDAIRHYFETYGHESEAFLPKNYQSHLVVKKYLDHAIECFKNGRLELMNKLLKKARNEPFQFRNMPYFLKFLAYKLTILK